MVMFSANVWILASLSFVNGFVGSEDKLVAVSVLYRHGDRTITSSYPNDPYKNCSFWPVPYGELTNIGKRQQYALGKWLRQRYNGFLSSKYLAKEFHIQASNYDRTLMSAASNLAGLYPPEGDQIWNPALSWQPIPIHTMPTKLDGMLALEKPCPKYSRLYEELLQTKFYKDIDNENRELYSYLTEKTGENMNSIVAVNDLYDTLFIEDLYNFTLPEWTKPVYPDKLRKLALIKFESDTHTPDLAKFQVGQLFDKILKQFDSFVSNSSSIQKFQVYSAHDTNVFPVLNSLGIPNLQLVPYASMVFFELRQRGDGEYYVQFYFKKGKDADLMKIEGCREDCDYDKFKQILEPLSLTEDQWENECNLKNARRR